MSWERQSKFGTLGALEGTGACRGALQTHRIEREKEGGEERERERERERESSTAQAKNWAAVGLCVQQMALSDA